MNQDLTDTYWNHNGKLQNVVAQLQAHVPQSGTIDNQPALELFRKASNCYYDLYNNGLCNRAAEFASIFRGVRSSDVQAVETRMTEIIAGAAIEQGLEIHVEVPTGALADLRSMRLSKICGHHEGLSPPHGFAWQRATGFKASACRFGK